MIRVAWLSELGKDSVGLYVRAILAWLNFVVDDLHDKTASRVSICLRLQLVLQKHDLVSAWSLVRLVDKARVQ